MEVIDVVDLKEGKQGRKQREVEASGSITDIPTLGEESKSWPDDIKSA